MADVTDMERSIADTAAVMVIMHTAVNARTATAQAQKIAPIATATATSKKRRTRTNETEEAPASSRSQSMNIIKSKYTILALSFMCFVLGFFPMQSGEITDGEACTMVIHGYNFMEFSAPSIVILIAPLLVPTILFGCQCKQAKELELILLVIVNSICFLHGANAARGWLLDIGATIYGNPTPAIILYPMIFILLCFAAIIKNKDNRSNSYDDIKN